MKARWKVAPPPPFDLADKQVDVWRAAPDSLLDDESALSQREREVTSRLAPASLRDSYAARYGFVRAVTARYLGRSPADIQIEHGPRRTLTVAGTSIVVSFSQAPRLFLCALGKTEALGIEVLRVGALTAVEVELMAPHVLTSSELSYFGGLAPDVQPEALHRLWALKEALYRSLTEPGLLGLRDLELTLNADGDAGVSSIGGTPVSGGGWALFEFNVAPGYVGAIAVRGLVDSWSFWDLQQPRPTSSVGA